MLGTLFVLQAAILQLHTCGQWNQLTIAVGFRLIIAHLATQPLALLSRISPRIP